MDIKGSKTEINLYKTFAGESRARNKYNFYAEKAREEGYRWVGEIFDETAHNEMAHARESYKRYLKQVGNTCENLEDAIMGEVAESKKIYKEFEETARCEGFDEIADYYKDLQEVEESHGNRFKMLAKMLKEDTMFKDSDNDMWKCMNCGYIYEGDEAPKRCPLCKYPRSYFKPYLITI